MATSPPERWEEFYFEKLILFGEKGFSHHVGWGSSLYLGDIDNGDQRGAWHNSDQKNYHNIIF